MESTAAVGFAEASRTVCVLSHDIVGAAMAGPGIRYFHMAQILSEVHRVTLAVPPNSAIETGESAFQTVVYSDWQSLAPHVQDQDVLIVPGDLAARFPKLAESKAAVVIDGYNPLLAEWLAVSAGYSPAERAAWWPDRLRQLTHQYLVGDFYLCASERQRDWWLGLLEASGRLNPANYHGDPSLRDLIDVVPFGLPEHAPQWRKPVIKGLWPGIEREDKVLLWGGGLWPWLDPLTAIHAVAEIGKVRQDVRLIFPGTRHPNPRMAEMPTHSEAAKSLAGDLGLLNSSVFFGDWIPYAEWPSALLECDVALSLHFDTLETRLAFRTRVLDYIWAGLPIVTTCGDETSNIVAEYEIGRVVDYQDVRGVADAILALLAEPGSNGRSANFARARQDFNWRRALEPLLRFCAHPRRAADRACAAIHPGNPYYATVLQQWVERSEDLQQQLDAAHTELNGLRQREAACQETINAYERGRFMRIMRWLDRLKPGFMK